MQLFVSDLPLNQSEYTAESPLIRIEWTTGNGILMSSSHWPTYNKFPPAYAAGKLEAAFKMSHLILSTSSQRVRVSQIELLR